MAAEEVPPPGDGVVTLTVTVPGDDSCALEIVAVSSETDTYVVVRTCPLKLIVDKFVKFVPITVMLVSPEPAATDTGEIVLSIGSGYTSDRVAAPDLLVSSVDVAVMMVGPVVLVGAVKVAVSLAVDAMLPRFAAHVTVGSKLPVPCTVAVHWLVWPSGTMVGLHATPTEVMMGGAVIVIVAVPDFVASCVEVAVMVAEPELGTVAGAV